MSQVSAADRVMEAVMDGTYYDTVSDKLLAQAVREGLSTRFSFYIGPGCEGVAGEDYRLPVDDSEDEDAYHNVAFIYPSGTDSTFKVPAIIRPMIPSAIGVDGCMETEWYFPKQLDTPAKIAQFLTGHGFKWDQDMQKLANKDLIGEIKSALEEKAALEKQSPARRRRGGIAGPGSCMGRF